MKKADVFLGTIVLLACVLWLGGRIFLRKQGAYAVVELDGQVYGSYALDEEQEIDIGEGNHISIRDGSVRMASADCPDQICVRQGSISRNGAMITCLPNRVTVQVRAKGEQEAKEQNGTTPDVVVY